MMSDNFFSSYFEQRKKHVESFFIKSEVDNIEKSEKYLSKHIGKNGKWTYVYQNKDFSKNLNKMYDLQGEVKDLQNDIKDLKKQREHIFQEQENDPEIELEGGPIADEYGDKLNKLDKKIELIKQQISSINSEISSINLGNIHVESDEDVPASLLQAHTKQEEEKERKRKETIEKINGTRDREGLSKAFETLGIIE